MLPFTISNGEIPQRVLWDFITDLDLGNIGGSKDQRY